MDSHCLAVGDLYVLAGCAGEVLLEGTLGGPVTAQECLWMLPNPGLLEVVCLLAYLIAYLVAVFNIISGTQKRQNSS